MVCSRVLKHLRGPVHIANVKKFTRNYSEKDRKVALTQIKLVLLNVERNISFFYSDHLIPTLKECITDSAIVNDLKLCQFQTKVIVCENIAPAWKKRLYEIER